MRAAILSIGDELVLGQCVDTNSAWLAEELLSRSVETLEHRTVGDEREAIAAAVLELAGQCDLLILTGGLGPTDDDLTRQALGDVVAPGEGLLVDEEAEGQIRRWFAGRGGEMPTSNLLQAMRPEPMRMLRNRHGTAPGLAGEHGGCRIVALPGPPREMRPMFEGFAAEALGEASGSDRVVTEAVHSYGLGESRAAELLGELTAREHEPKVGITASDAIISARIRGSGREDVARASVMETVAQVEALWKPYCFGRGEQTLEAVVGELLRGREKTVVTAESCTGGWLGKRLVDVAGSSDYYRGGWITYSNGLKQLCLGVPGSMLDENGAVSEPVARAMAEGALREGQADYSVAITGIAGPGGGGPEKPEGTVYIGLGRTVGGTVVRRFRFHGGRSVVRDRSSKAALQMLRLALIGAADDLPLIWELREASSQQVDGI